MKTAPQVDPSRRISEMLARTTEGKSPHQREGQDRPAAEKQHLDWLRWSVGVGQEHTGRPDGERIPVGGSARPYDAPQARAVAPQKGRSWCLHSHTSSVWCFLGTRRQPLTALAFSGVRIGCDPTRLHGCAEGRVVSFGLVGVAFREIGYRPIEALALAEVARNLHAVAGAGVRAGQRPAADAGVEDKLISRHTLDFRGAFHVLQLAPVEVAAFRAAKPAQE